MMRRPRYTSWPDLVYRANKDAHEAEHAALEALLDRQEASFVEHLRSCSDCRKRVAQAARSGEKVSQRILQAAGVEVLN